MKTAWQIHKTNASPQGLTFCHKVIRTVRKYQATASHIRHGIRRWHRISEMDCRRPQTPFIHTGSRLLIPEAYALVDAAVNGIVKIESAAA